MTRKTAVAGFSYLAGLFIASFFSLWLSFGIGGVFLCAGICILLFSRSKSARLAVCLISCSAGILLYSIYDLWVYRPVTENDGMPFEGSCKITSAEYYAAGGAQYTAELTLPKGGSGKAAFYSYTENDLVPGDTVTLKGTLTVPDSGGFFDSRDYYRTSGIFLIADDAQILSVTPKENNIFEYINAFRTRTVSRMRSVTDGDACELMIGMLFGSGSWDISYRAEKSLYKAGIGHTAAVSGMHMSIICGMISALLSAVRCPAKLKFLCIMICMGLFALTAGMTISVLRSMIMILIVCSGDMFNRRSDPLTSLAIAAVLLTLTEPFSIRNTSFMLSFSGVLGTAVFAPTVISAMESRINKNRIEGEKFTAGPVLTSAVTALCAAAAVFPASAACFDEISVISPVANMLLSPLCTVSLTLSVIGAAIGIIPWLSSVSSVFFLFSWAVCRPILAVSEYLGELSSAAVPAELDITAPLIMIITICTAAGILLFKRRVYVILTLSAGVFIFSVCSSVYMLIPQSSTEIAVLTEGNGCVIAISDATGTQLYDFMGTKSGASAADSFITRKGLAKVNTVVLTRNADNTAEIYKEIFPSAAVIAPDAETGLTYSEEDTIISIGNCKCLPGNGYFIIEAEGAEIICISRSSEPPDRQYELAVYNCIADANVASGSYAVTQRRFKGYIPPAAPCAKYETSAYVIVNGTVCPKEDVRWLR